MEHGSRYAPSIVVNVTDTHTHIFHSFAVGHFRSRSSCCYEVEGQEVMSIANKLKALSRPGSYDTIVSMQPQSSSYKRPPTHLSSQHGLGTLARSGLLGRECTVPLMSLDRVSVVLLSLLPPQEK